MDYHIPTPLCLILLLEVSIMTKKVLIILLILSIISNCSISAANELTYHNSPHEGSLGVKELKHGFNENNDKSKVNVSKWDNMRAYWMWTVDIDNFDPVELKNSGITDVFIVTKGTSGKLYYSELEKTIQKCKPQGIRVHAWIICFKDESKGAWVDQTDQSYQNYLRSIINHIIDNYEVDGIHLDYVRYSGDESKNHAAWQQPGGTTQSVNTITGFVQSVYDIVKAKNPDLAVSAALMPQMEINAPLYAQDYSRLADYLDFIVPMIYRGTFKTDNAWIGSTTKWIVEHSKGVPVIAGIMTYHSDEDQTILPPLELFSDVKIALQNGASGFALFRYGLTLEVPQIDKIIPNEPSKKENDNQNSELPVKLTKTIPMQKTGLPLLLIIFSFLAIISGFILKSK